MRAEWQQMMQTENMSDACEICSDGEQAFQIAKQTYE